MASNASSLARQGETRFEHRSATRDPLLIRVLVLTVALGFFAVFLLLPLVVVFAEALRKGVETYWAALVDPDAQSAIRLTLLAAAVAVVAVWWSKMAWSVPMSASASASPSMRRSNSPWPR